MTDPHASSSSSSDLRGPAGGGEDSPGAVDVHQLFVYYDGLYFGGQLVAHGVCVRWSSARMTLCAGLCQYRGAAGGCEITLSEPLLRYRSVGELKETLLHEMIHAVLFVAVKNRDHGDHGPLFQKWMHEINVSTLPDFQRPKSGYHITIYHNFHAEVDFYRRHHWRCSRCGSLVKRAMNRLPSEKDCRAYR
eukprot:RCo009749